MTDLVDRVASLRTIGAVSVVLTIAVVTFAVLHKSPRRSKRRRRSRFRTSRRSSSSTARRTTTAWLSSPGPARTGAFHSRRASAHVLSEARMVGGRALYLALYAADEDIRTRATRPTARYGSTTRFADDLARTETE